MSHRASVCGVFVHSFHSYLAGGQDSYSFLISVFSKPQPVPICAPAPRIPQFRAASSSEGQVRRETEGGGGGAAGVSVLLSGASRNCISQQREREA